MTKPPIDAVDSANNDTLELGSRIAREYADALEAEILTRTALHAVDLAYPLADEVRFGLLSRQARFAATMARGVNLWAEDIGRLIARPMLETYITLAWLVKKGAKSDYEAFVQYGLGQEKLAIEHAKARNREDGVPEDARGIADREKWLSQFQYAFLTEVNVGQWASKNVREMAEEVEEKVLYDLLYTPFSAEVHGMWNAVARSSLRHCQEPLHRFHLVPNLDPAYLVLEAPILAAELMRKTYRVWEASTSLAPLPRTTTDDFIAEINAL